MVAYKTLNGAKAMVDLGYDSSYFRFVHVVARDGNFLTCWSDETVYVPKSDKDKARWTGRRETGVNVDGAWVRVIHWTRVDGAIVEPEITQSIDVEIDIALAGIGIEDELEFEEELLA